MVDAAASPSPRSTSKLVWDMIRAVKVGETGYAYIVDGTGRLIADPD